MKKIKDNILLITTIIVWITVIVGNFLVLANSRKVRQNYTKVIQYVEHNYEREQKISGAYDTLNTIIWNYCDTSRMSPETLDLVNRYHNKILRLKKE